ncbi:MAG: plastocyanin/azurin family copper-binding protein [Chloroflexi bacterium]|nr:plastocyanin/azurin family copper-binding protein [Chloroflexota bacterium]
MLKQILAIALLATVGLVAAACGASDTPTPTSLPAATATPTPTSPSSGPDVREITVTTEDFFFDPSGINLTPGEKVKFTVTNPTSEFHTFTIALTSGKDQILLDLPLIGGETQSAEFTVPPGSDSLYLFCIPHESIGMTGSVNVGG